ncbi:MAG: hypothetical protein JNM36_01880 [Chitinophagales bacterium]|nr:hypothetical protein [Chitinophagales bacterium]
MIPCNERFEAHCLEWCDQRQNISVEENKRKYLASNTQQNTFALYRIDGCVIKDGERCDFLLLKCEENGIIAYFIELKGSDLTRALEQINASIDKLLPKLKPHLAVHARIVLTKVNAPDIKGSDYIKLSKKIRQLGGTIKQQVRLIEEKL